MKSCLIVDDSKVIRKVARHILETLDFTVDEAEDGRQALSRVEAHMPDVVLLDWNMPVWAGWSFCRASGPAITSPAEGGLLHHRERFAHIRAAIDAGADEYVMKPFDRETLESKLQIVGVG
jgi:two-component system chemotaxis response regulator CheY